MIFDVNGIGMGMGVGIRTFLLTNVGVGVGRRVDLNKTVLLYKEG